MPHKGLRPISPRWFIALVAVLAVAAGSETARALTAAGAEQQFTQLVNDARTAQALTALTRDPGLDVVAREWSAEMARTGNFDHRPDLAGRVAQVEPERRAWAENIAWRSDPGGLDASDVRSMHSGLMASPGHHANIMGNFNRVGVGVHIQGNAIWVTFNFLRGPPLPTASPTTTGPPATAPTAPGTTATGNADPVGRFRLTRLARDKVRITGWAVDPDTAAPIDVRIRAGHRLRVVVATRPRTDVARVFPTLGSRHGFAVVVRVARNRRVCVSALDATSRAPHRLGCRTAK